MSIIGSSSSFRRGTVTLRRRAAGAIPLIPIIILGTIAFMAIFADVLAPHNPEIGSLTARFHPPVWQTGGNAIMLGTDQLGRDVLSRLIFGTRLMVVGFTAVIFAGAGRHVWHHRGLYIGGWADQIIMRITDAWLALPALTFAIFLAAIVGAEHVEHRHHSRRGLLDTLCTRGAR